MKKFTGFFWVGRGGRIKNVWGDLQGGQQKSRVRVTDTTPYNQAPKFFFRCIAYMMRVKKGAGLHSWTALHTGVKLPTNLIVHKKSFPTIIPQVDKNTPLVSSEITL